MINHTLIQSSTESTLPLSVLDQVAPCNWLNYAMRFEVDSSNIEAAAKNLNEGIRLLITIIPPLGGHIDYIDPEGDDSRLIVKYTPGNPGLVFTVRDFRYQTDPETFKQNPDPPTGSPVPDEGKVPVFVAQANVFDDNILLGVRVHHAFTDGIGANHIIQRLSETCFAIAKGKKPPSEPFHLDRSRISTLSAPSHQDAEPKSIIRKYLHIRPPFPEDADHQSKPNCPVKRLVVSAEAMQKLKAKLSLHLQNAEKSVSDRGISSNDVLCAFLWHSISAARLETAADVFRFAKEESTLIMAVDIRSKLPLPDPGRFIGNAFMHVKCRKSIRQLSNTSLETMAETAAMIRQSVDGVTKRTVVELITALDGVEDFDENSLGSGMDNGVDVDLTSMLNASPDQQSWGSLLGKPSKVRRSGMVTPDPARQGARDGFVRVLPKQGNGSIVIEMSLRHDAAKVLLEN